jgi:glycosyltransferase involved in cell wall biosynthesis
VTPEYPPDGGGVADYVAVLAPALAAAAGEVHVWAPGPSDATTADAPGVVVHRRHAPFTRHGLRALGRALDELEGPRVVLVEYVPHGFGRKGMNLAFVAWVRGRRRRGDDVRVMFHEVAYPWVVRPLRHNLLAAVQRLMGRRLLRAATRAYVSIPGWVPLLESLGADRTRIVWTPVPATIPDHAPPAHVAEVRRRLVGADPSAPLVGHFGTYGAAIALPLRTALAALLERRPDVCVLLLGDGGVRWRDEFVRAHPSASAQLVATGRLAAAEVAAHLRACDLVIQPYPDGISSRRSSAMAALVSAVAVVTTTGALTEPIFAGAVALAPADRPAELAGLALGLLDDRPARERLGAGGRALYEASFTIDRTVAALTRP